MRKPESVLESETRKIPLDFETQADSLILSRRPDLEKVKKKEKKKKKRNRNKEIKKIIKKEKKRTCGIIDFA